MRETQTLETILACDTSTMFPISWLDSLEAGGLQGHTHVYTCVRNCRGRFRYVYEVSWQCREASKSEGVWLLGEIPPGQLYILICSGVTVLGDEGGEVTGSGPPPQEFIQCTALIADVVPVTL